ncbi:MAG: flagellar brake protein [Nitrosomonas sp.]|nr:flagellar brake protein [Nitrosomonas sp.]
MSKPNPGRASSEIMKSIELSQKKIDENFRVHSEIEIFFILRGIMRKNSLITLYYDDEDSFILTSILDIDTHRKEIIIDYNTDNEPSRQILQAKTLAFVTSQNGVKIEFTCDKIRKTNFKGQNTFAVKAPKSLVRMQRRNSFRITTPITKPLKCIIAIPSSETYTKAEITILDISCGGIGVIDHHPIISFDPGIVYKDCQIDLPEIGTVTVNIKVKSTYEVTLRNKLTCKRSGCEFINLPAKMEAMIQRYIVKLEQARKTQ